MSGASTPPWLKVILNETPVNSPHISPIVSPIVSPIAFQHGRQSTEPFPAFGPPPSSLAFDENGYGVPLTPERQTDRFNEVPEPPRMSSHSPCSPDFTHLYSPLAQPHPVFPSGPSGFSPVRDWTDEMIKKNPPSSPCRDDFPTLRGIGSPLGSPFNFPPPTGLGAKRIQPTFLFGSPNPPTTTGSGPSTGPEVNEAQPKFLFGPANSPATSDSGPARPPTSFRRTPGGERMWLKPSPVRRTAPDMSAGGERMWLGRSPGRLTAPGGLFELPVPVTQAFTAGKQNGGKTDTDVSEPRTPSRGSLCPRFPIRETPGKKGIIGGPLLVNVGPDSPTPLSKAHGKSSPIFSFGPQEQQYSNRGYSLLNDTEFFSYPLITPEVKDINGEPSHNLSANPPSSDTSTDGVPLDPFTSPEPSLSAAWSPFGPPGLERSQTPIDPESRDFIENSDFCNLVPTSPLHGRPGPEPSSNTPSANIPSRETRARALVGLFGGIFDFSGNDNFTESMLNDPDVIKYCNEILLPLGSEAGPSTAKAGLSPAEAGPSTGQRSNTFVPPTPLPPNPVLFPTPPSHEPSPVRGKLPSRSINPLIFGRGGHHSCIFCTSPHTAPPRSTTPFAFGQLPFTPGGTTPPPTNINTLYTPATTPKSFSRPLAPFTLHPHLSTVARSCNSALTPPPPSSALIPPTHPPSTSPPPTPPLTPPPPR